LRNPLLRFVVFLLRIWFLYAWARFTFPVFVRLNRFFAPLCVFIFGTVSSLLSLT